MQLFPCLWRIATARSAGNARSSDGMNYSEQPASGIKPILVLNVLTFDDDTRSARRYTHALLVTPLFYLAFRTISTDQPIKRRSLVFPTMLHVAFRASTISCLLQKEIVFKERNDFLFFVYVNSCWKVVVYLLASYDMRHLI